MTIKKFTSFILFYKEFEFSKLLNRSIKLYPALTQKYTKEFNVSNAIIPEISTEEF
jgi:hypothetical protein